MRQLREALINLDPEIINVDACSTLLPFCPLADEVRACKSYKEPTDKLDNVYDYMRFIPNDILGKPVLASYSRYSSNGTSTKVYYIQS